MKLYTKETQAQYMQNDWVLRLQQEMEQPIDAQFRVQQWHKEITAKRMIYSDLYGDLVDIRSGGARVLDIGGGYTSLTRLLVKNCDYTLDDFMAHGDGEALRDIEKHLGQTFWVSKDWYDFVPEREYDIIIANDIFPDVDQRLELFIEKFLGYCKELRMSLTYYNVPKFYTTRRVDDTEMLTFLSYDGRITRMILESFRDRVKGGWDESVAAAMLQQNESLYRNGRQAMQVTLLGDIK